MSAPTGFPANFTGMYGRDVGDILECPAIDSACVETDGTDLTISIFLHGLAYQHTVAVSSFVWTQQGSNFTSETINFPSHGGTSQLIWTPKKIMLTHENERTKGPRQTADGMIEMAQLKVIFVQLLAGSGTMECLSPKDTGVYKNPTMSDPYKVVCNGFIVGEGYFDSKTVKGGRIGITQGVTNYQIDVGSSSADTFLWVGDDTSTKPATDFWTMDKSFLELGGSTFTLPVNPLPDKYRGTYQSTTKNSFGNPDFYVTLKENSYSVSAASPQIVWTDTGGEFPYEYLVTFDDLVIGRGQYGTDFILSPAFSSVALYDANGIDASTVVPGGPSRPSTSSSKSDSGMGPLLVVALLLGFLWAMK